MARGLCRRGDAPNGPVEQSYLETRVVQELRRVRLPDFERQVEMSDEEGFLGFVDFRHDAGVVIEAVGATWHFDRWNPDRERDARLGAGTYRFIPATFDAVEQRTGAFTDLVARALDRATRERSER